MLRRELVDEEQWLSSARFNRLLAVYQVLPGPEAHELAVHLGMIRGGKLGGLLAGLGFMLPGFCLMLLLSWLYFQDDLTQAAIAAALLGVQIGVVALVARAIWRIGRHVLVETGPWLIGIAAAAATLAGVSFLIVLPIAGLSHVLGGRARLRGVYIVVLAAAFAALVWVAISTGLTVPQAVTPVLPGAPATSPSIVELLISGLKAGLLTFGGAYTAIPFIRGDAVGSGWLTDAQFLDGLALSGILPAPLIIFATFVGYVAGGPTGAIAITLGVFLPAFAFSLLFRDRLEAVIDNPVLHRLLEGVAAGVVGLIAVTAVDLAASLALRVPSVILALLILGVALLVLARTSTRASVPLVLAGSALAGYVAFGLLPR